MRYMEDDGKDKCVAVIEIMNKHTSEQFTDDDVNLSHGPVSQFKIEVHMLKVLAK